MAFGKRRMRMNPLCKCRRATMRLILRRRIGLTCRIASILISRIISLMKCSKFYSIKSIPSKDKIKLKTSWYKNWNSMCTSQRLKSNENWKPVSKPTKLTVSGSSLDVRLATISRPHQIASNQQASSTIQWAMNRANLRTCMEPFTILRNHTTSNKSPAPKQCSLTNWNPNSLRLFPKATQQTTSWR